MNNEFDELTKQMAQSVTRRQAFTRFGLGLASIALTCFGLANRAEAQGKCSQAGVLCFRGLLSLDPSGRKDCGKCCSGSYVCYQDWIAKNCYCQ